MTSIIKLAYIVLNGSIGVLYYAGIHRKPTFGCLKAHVIKHENPRKAFLKFLFVSIANTAIALAWLILQIESMLKSLLTKLFWLKQSITLSLLVITLLCILRVWRLLYVPIINYPTSRLTVIKIT